MAPTIKVEVPFAEEPMSKTDQYRKVMKPLIERKRRARINACLDELKDLMVYALQSEGESISKLEKADVLELTVKHLRKLKRQQMLAVNPGLDMDRYRAGYTTCATEVSRCLASTGVDVTIGSRLMSHLGNKLNTIETSDTLPLLSEFQNQEYQNTSECHPQFLMEDTNQAETRLLHHKDFLLSVHLLLNKNQNAFGGLSKYLLPMTCS